MAVRKVKMSVSLSGDLLPKLDHEASERHAGHAAGHALLLRPKVEELL